MFSLELQHRLTGAGSHILSVSAHPGMSIGTAFRRSAFLRRLVLFITSPLNNPVSEAMKPTLLAATGPGVRGGDYIGPLGPLSFRGDPGRSYPTPQALDLGQSKLLWDRTNELTGATWPMLDDAIAASN